MSGVFAIDVKGTKIRACMVSADGAPADVVEERVVAADSPEPLVDQIVELSNQVSGGAPIRGVLTPVPSIRSTGASAHALNPAAVVLGGGMLLGGGLFGPVVDLGSLAGQDLAALACRPLPPRHGDRSPLATALAAAESALLMGWSS